MADQSNDQEETQPRTLSPKALDDRYTQFEDGKNTYIPKSKVVKYDPHVEEQRRRAKTELKGKRFTLLFIFLIGVLLMVTGGVQIWVAERYDLKDFYILGPGLLVIGFIMVFVGVVLITRAFIQIRYPDSKLERHTRIIGGLQQDRAFMMDNYLIEQRLATGIKENENINQTASDQRHDHHKNHHMRNSGSHRMDDMEKPPYHPSDKYVYESSAAGSTVASPSPVDVNYSANTSTDGNLDDEQEVHDQKHRAEDKIQEKSGQNEEGQKAKSDLSISSALPDNTVSDTNTFNASIASKTESLELQNTRKHDRNTRDREQDSLEVTADITKRDNVNVSKVQNGEEHIIYLPNDSGYTLQVKDEDEFNRKTNQVYNIRPDEDTEYVNGGFSSDVEESIETEVGGKSNEAGNKRDKNSEVTNNRGGNSDMGTDRDKNSDVGNNRDKNSDVGNNKDKNSEVGNDKDKNSDVGNNKDKNSDVGNNKDKNSDVGNNKDKNSDVGNNKDKNSDVGNDKDKNSDVGNDKDKNSDVGNDSRSVPKPCVYVSPSLDQESTVTFF